MSNPQILQELILPGKKNRPGKKITVTSITIHNTDNSNKGAGAKAHSKFVRETGYYMLNGEKHWVSWHFSVDDTYIIQHLPLDEVAFHAGSAANGSSIAIEICMNSDNDQAAGNRRAAALVASLLTRFDWTTDRLKKHKDWTGKACPSQLLTPAKWAAFKKLVDEQMKSAALPPLTQSEVESARQARPASTDVEAYDLDHEAVGAFLELGRHDHGGHVETVRETPAEAIKGVIEALASSGAHALPRFYEHGINHIEIDLSTSGFKLTVKGPDSAGKVESPDEVEDTVPDFRSDADVARASVPVNSYLSDSNSVYGTHSSNRRYGVERTIEAINKVAKDYHALYGIRLGIGDISKQGGGRISGHASHRLGVDVDVRVPRKDTAEAASNYKDASYSREHTQKLVQLFRNCGFPVIYIFFNDPQVSGVSPWPNHDNHLHVRFDINAAGNASS